MRIECEVIRDLLPLYADDACSGKSRELVEEHLRECPACSGMLESLRRDEIESSLQKEKSNVLQYGEKRFRRRSATVGTVMAGIFMIPILVCLIVNLATGAGLTWFFVVLAALLVAASLILVPLLVPEDRLLWTFCSFVASLQVLLAVVCIYSRGRWFWIASSATLFGLGLVFLPFVVRARPVRQLLAGANPVGMVLAADAVLFLNLMATISARGSFSWGTGILVLGCLAGLALVVLEVLRRHETADGKTEGKTLWLEFGKKKDDPTE